MDPSRYADANCQRCSGEGVVDVEEWSREEYENLPEWDGW